MALESPVPRRPDGAAGAAHVHTAVSTHAVRQRDGVPYEVRRTVCAECARVLGERPLRRAAA